MVTLDDKIDSLHGRIDSLKDIVIADKAAKDVICEYHEKRIKTMEDAYMSHIIDDQQAIGKIHKRLNLIIYSVYGGLTVAGIIWVVTRDITHLLANVLQ